MSLPIQPYKGARDFYPEDLLLRDYLFSKIRTVVQSYGYEEYDAPLIELIELYKAKSGSEIVSEQTYSFIDRGGREVAIRPEMTPSVSRMVAARRQQLAYPLRWFSIPNLWRYERPQRGRFREHWQLNVDIFGVSSVLAEIEMIQVADSILKDLGATPAMYEIRVNHRGLLEQIFNHWLKLNTNQNQDLARLVDRKDKLERNKFIDEVDTLLTGDQKRRGTTEKLLSVLGAESLDELPSELRKSKPAAELQQLLDACKREGVNNVKFAVSVVRGFDYYSGLVFELYDMSPENNRSMLGGGRYDGLVGLFGVEPVPTVGFGLGDSTLANFLSLHGLTPTLDNSVDVYVAIVAGEDEAALSAASELRNHGLNVALDFSNKKLGEQIRTANKKRIRFVLIVGPNEVKDQRFTLRDLISSSESRLRLNQVVEAVVKTA